MKIPLSHMTINNPNRHLVDFYSSYLLDFVCFIRFTIYNTLLFLIVGGGQIANFGEKYPQVHLIIIREWPKNNPPL